MLPLDFDMNATSPSAVNVNESVMSTITVTPLNGFSGTVTISDNPSDELTCEPIMPTLVRGPGIATVSCVAKTAGRYDLTLTGTSGSLVHTTTATFNFQDFALFASSPTGAVGAPVSSTISITSLNGFTGDVTLTGAPQPGLTCGSITPNSITGSGVAIVSCSAKSVDNYYLTIQAKSSLLTHYFYATFRIANLPFFLITTTSPTTNNAGEPASSTITIKALNLFADTVALTDIVPTSLNCQPITPSSVTGSETATVSCSSEVAGTYILIVTGTSNSLVNSAPITFSFVDFSIVAISPAKSTVGLSASSTIIINLLNGFAGTVRLGEIVPTGLNCGAISPISVSSSGLATISCSATVAGTYALTLTGTSSSLAHNATATFIFLGLPDFTISVTAPVSFASGSTADSSVTVTAENGLSSKVSLFATVSPSTGLSVSLDPQSFIYGTGMSMATFSSSKPGSYTVAIAGKDGSLIHTATVPVTVTAWGTGSPDVTLSSSVSSLSFSSGASGSATITVTSRNGFTGTITLAVTAPAGVACSLSATSIQSSGTSILTCNGSTTGDYTITIKATGGASPHTTTVSVHVAAVSPAAPTPSMIVGLTPAIFYGIMTGIIVAIVAGTVLARRSRRFMT